VGESSAAVSGLSEAEAESCLRAEGANELPRPDRRTLARIVLDVVLAQMPASADKAGEPIPWFWRR
jgi:P-type Ca2+ transporter type 2C